MGGDRKAIVAGAGGFIGHHLVTRLKAEGVWVRGVDVREPKFGKSHADEFVTADLRDFENCVQAVRGVDDVYQLAADMGGIGYITSRFASLTRNNILINTNMLEASRLEGVQRYLFSSSACVYPAYLQKASSVEPLREEAAIPSDPEKGYGWEKLFAEQLTTYYREDHNLDVRIVRFHNIYGPLGTYDGGREKAPAAICRKVAEAEQGSSIEVWGDGKQTRSFCFIDDCVEGLVRIMGSGFSEPINLGSEELVTVDQLFDYVCEIAGKSLVIKHDPTKAQGVRGRNSDNRLLRKVLNWEPKTKLKEGLPRTYLWIWTQLFHQGRAKSPAPKPTLTKPVPTRS